MEYEAKLIYTMKKKRKALIEKRARLRRHQRDAIISGICTAGPLLYIILYTPEEASQVVSSISGNVPITISLSSTSIIGMTVAVVSSVLLTYSLKQYEKQKKKYDAIRKETMDSFELPVCNCKWSVCTCKDDFIEDMDENFDVNLSY